MPPGVIPANAGIQLAVRAGGEVDPSFRWDDTGVVVGAARDPRAEADQSSFAIDFLNCGRCFCWASSMRSRYWP